METTACSAIPEATHPELERLVSIRTQELKIALERAQSLYDQAPCGYLSLDADLRFVGINRTLLDWLGFEREALDELQDFSELLDPHEAGRMRHHMRVLAETGTTEAMELSLRRHNGASLQVLCSSTAVVDPHGHFLYSNSTLVDISARKDAERRLEAHDAFLHSITQRIPSHLAYYDKDLICRFANLAHAAQYGKQVHDMIGVHLSQLVNPEQLPDILPHVADALNGQSQTFEAERHNEDGTRSFFETHYVPDVQRGTVEGIFIELHDITERRRTEEFVLEANRDLEERVRERTAELFQSEQRYRLMVDAIQDHCIYFIDESGIVSEWTESAQRLHGFAKSQMTAKPYLRLLAVDNSGEDEVDPAQLLRLAIAHGQWETRGWRLRDDGSRFWAHTVMTALRNEGGELQGLSCITRDMTAAKGLEDLMNDLNKELEKRVAERTQQLVAANKDLDVFSHTVSHDLRSPLRHISSFIGLLQERIAELNDPIASQYIHSMTKSSKRMGRMIEGLLEYARLGRVAVEVQPIPLNPLLEGLMSHLKQESPDRQIEWVIADDLPVVRGDTMLLAQAFGNLLDNAVKYTKPRDKAHIEIGWRINPVGGRTFYVKDNGVGFDLEKAQNLFVMFQRQHHSMDFEGTGTGLALAQRIIERHGGRIWAETTPGEGCCFFFNLPFDGPEPEMAFPQSAMADLMV